MRSDRVTELSTDTSTDAPMQGTHDDNTVDRGASISGSDGSRDAETPSTRRTGEGGDGLQPSAGNDRDGTTDVQSDPVDRVSERSGSQVHKTNGNQHEEETTRSERGTTREPRGNDNKTRAEESIRPASPGASSAEGVENKQGSI